MQAPTNKTPLRPSCPTPPSLFGWLANLLGLSAPAYRGAGQPTGSIGGTFGQSPCYRPPRPRAAETSHGGDAAGPEPSQPIGLCPETGVPYSQPVLLEGPVTIVIGSRE
ncbi:MAG: hypothetical protein HS111_17030 [Kofleriaceae bacterium]|nr:hypothetical protein [Kofleriaceae bacterium]MCL4223126.1 hypothetical protein [Myxococcales bacterium]